MGFDEARHLRNESLGDEPGSSCKNGHRKAALWVRIAVTAAYGYAVMHNLRTASR
jgi:hypothetical protein